MRITTYRQNKIDFVYELRDLMGYLTTIPEDCRGIQYTVIFGDYKYEISFYKNIICLTRYCKTIKNTILIKNDIIIEECVLFNNNPDLSIPIHYPLQNGVIISFGNYLMTRYRKRTLKTNYCIYCGECFNNLKRHLHSKINIKRKTLIIQNALIHRLNTDCINNIISYL